MTTAHGPASPRPLDVTAGSWASAADRQPLWLYLVVIIGALGVLPRLQRVVLAATMLTSGQQLSDSARTWAHYSAPYIIALGAALLVPLAIRAWRVLTGILVQAAFAEVMLVHRRDRHPPVGTRLPPMSC